MDTLQPMPMWWKCCERFLGVNLSNVGPIRVTKATLAPTQDLIDKGVDRFVLEIPAHYQFATAATSQMCQIADHITP